MFTFCRTDMSPLVRTAPAYRQGGACHRRATSGRWRQPDVSPNRGPHPRDSPMVRPGFSRGPQIDSAVLGMGTHPVSHPTAARQRGAEPASGRPSFRAGHANGPLRPTWRTRTSAIKPRPGFVLIAHARIVSRCAEKSRQHACFGVCDSSHGPSPHPARPIIKRSLSCPGTPDRSFRRHQIRSSHTVP